VHQDPKSDRIWIQENKQVSYLNFNLIHDIYGGLGLGFLLVLYEPFSQGDAGSGHGHLTADDLTEHAEAILQVSRVHL
jgi:hypothetical protein